MPTVVKAADRHSVVATGWTNPANAFAVSGDNVYATAAPAKNGTISGDFGFPAFLDSEIPVGSTIDAVRLVAEWGLTAAVTGGTLGLRGVDNAVLDGAAEITQTVVTEQDVTFTFAFTPSILDLKTAGVVAGRVRCSRGNTNTSTTGHLDFIRIEVDYTEPSTPISGTDTGAGSEAQAMTSQASGTDANTAVTEIASSVAHVAGSDVSGVTSEVATVSQAFSGTDAGTGSEAQSVAPKISGADASSSTTETAGTSAVTSGADQNSAVTEIAVPSAQTSGSDISGPTTEVGSISRSVSGVDTGAGSEIGLQAVALAPTDFGASTEVASAQALANGTDANGATSEAQLVATKISGADSGTSLETASVVIHLTDSDVGSGAESGTVGELTTQKSGTDLGISVEAASANVLAASQDVSGPTMELDGISTTLSDFDALGTVTEASGVIVILADADVGTDSESWDVHLPPGLIFDSDFGFGREFQTVDIREKIAGIARMLVAAYTGRGLVYSAVTGNAILVGAFEPLPQVESVDEIPRPALLKAGVS